MADGTYEVGYGRPPRHTRFQAGLSGNPRGRPKTKKSLETLLYEALYEIVEVRVNGRLRRMPLIQAVVNTIIHKTVGGDARARRDLIGLLNRYPGTVAEVLPLRMIDETMTPREAADAYAATLRAIPGMVEPTFELEYGASSFGDVDDEAA